MKEVAEKEVDFFSATSSSLPLLNCPTDCTWRIDGSGGGGANVEYRATTINTSCKTREQISECVCARS